MSDIRKETATAYPSADALTGSETVMVIQDGHTKKTTVNDMGYKGILLGTRINATVDLTTTGTKYVDITAPTTPTGYSFVGYILTSTTYRFYPLGAAGFSRIYYNVVDTGTGQSMQITPVYSKN